MIDSAGNAFCTLIFETERVQIVLPDGTPAEELTAGRSAGSDCCGHPGLPDMLTGAVGPSGAPFAIKFDAKTLDVCCGKRGLTDTIIEEQGVSVMRQPVVPVSWIPKLVVGTAGVMCICAYYLGLCFGSSTRYIIELGGANVGTVDYLGKIECEDPVGLRAGLLCQAYVIWQTKLIMPMQSG